MSNIQPGHKTALKRAAIDEAGLIPGKVSEEQFELLMDGTSIRGDAVSKALKDHLVHGLTPVEAWEKHEVNRSQFSRRLSGLLEVSTRARKLSQFYR